jgi:hypothetical protein
MIYYLTLDIITIYIIIVKVYFLYSYLYTYLLAIELNKFERYVFLEKNSYGLRSIDHTTSTASPIKEPLRSIVK